jgi:hypothetical protein
MGSYLYVDENKDNFLCLLQCVFVNSSHKLILIIPHKTRYQLMMTIKSLLSARKSFAAFANLICLFSVT